MKGNQTAELQTAKIGDEKSEKPYNDYCLKV